MEPKGAHPITPGRLIRQNRENRMIKMTQQDLADEVSKRLDRTVTKNMVTKIEGDNRELSFEEAVAFADALGIGLDRMADVLYRNDAADLVQEAWTLISNRMDTLSGIHGDGMNSRLQEIRDRLDRTNTDLPDAVRFIKAYKKISTYLHKAENHIFSATGCYRDAGELMVGPVSKEPFDPNDIPGYDFESGEFT